MNMLKQKLTGALTACALLAQTAAVMPVQAVQSRSLRSFAAAVQRMTAQDSGRDGFTELTFDRKDGSLYRDGERTDGTVGDLTVRGGELMIDTGGGTGGLRAQSGGSCLGFEEAAADFGYTYTESGSIVTVKNDFQTARLIVKASGSIDPHGAQDIVSGFRDLHILQYADAASAARAYALYESDPAVEYVQPSHRVQLDPVTESAAVSGEEDEKTYMTWGADLIGTADFIRDYLDAEILPEVTVAVLDSGINSEPALFDGRILEGGVNYSNSGDDTVDDDMGHGTHCTGTICELTPSSVKILPVKVFDSSGGATDEQIYLGLLYAMDQGARIISMSFGGLGVSPLEVEALTIAEERGVICCAAAGNNADDARYFYPGGIESAITVGAVNNQMIRAGFSNYGDLVDVVAPGVGVLSYVNGGADQTERMNGTSMATPHVTACCALLRSYDPEITPARAEALLRINAIDLGEEGFDRDYAWGFVCMKNFRWDDGICLPPEFSLPAGNYGEAQTVSLETATEDAEIYYTTDGSIPSAENGIRYTEPLTVSHTVWIRAVTVRKGFLDSAKREAVYSIGGEDVPEPYSVKNGVLTAYRGVLRSLELPEMLGGERITAIGEGAFRGNPFLGQITLPRGVTVIGKEAFAACPSLQSVTAPGAAELGEGCFSDCTSLTELQTAERLKSVGKAAFSGCVSLRELSLEGAAELPEDCCAGCRSLVKLTAQDAAAFLDSALQDCSALTELRCSWDSVTAIGNLAFSGCKAWAGAISLPSLKTLGERAFADAARLRAVSLPAGITELAAGVFSGCSGMWMLSAPGLTYLAADALALKKSSFDLVTDLNTDALTHIGTNALYGFPFGTGAEAVSFSALRKADYRTFAGVLAGGIILPGITVIGEQCFADANVSILTAEAAEEIGAGALTGCRAAVLSAKAQKIAPDAWKAGLYAVCTETDMPNLDGTPEFELCAEPLVMGGGTQSLSAAQYGYAPLRVLAGGIALRYAWYLGDTPLECTDTVLEADTSAPGSYDYRCVMTDAAGKTEQAAFALTVAAAEAEAEPLSDAAVFSEGGAQVFQILHDGTQPVQLTAFGAVPVTGRLLDLHGQTLAELVPSADGKMSLSADLPAGTYRFAETPVWEDVYMLTRSANANAGTVIRSRDLSITAQSSASDGVRITVTAPDGTRLAENRDYLTVVRHHNQYRYVSVFGIGSCCGYADGTACAYPAIAADTVIPVSLTSAGDTAVLRFVPKTAGSYGLYATRAAGFAQEQLAYNRAGRHRNGSRYVSIRTNCTVSDSPDGSGSQIASFSGTSSNGGYFSGEAELVAGKSYYFLISAESAAEFNFTVSQTPPVDLRNAVVRGNFICSYTGSPFFPQITVTLDGTELQEHTDYERIDVSNDVPGEATLTVVGIGRYCGKRELHYQITLVESAGEITYTPLDTAVPVKCAAGQTEKIWFRAELAPGPNKKARYRVLNQKTSGGQLVYSLFRYDAVTGLYAPVEHDSLADDYELKNGDYCIMVHRKYADVSAAANFTVVIPHDLALATVTANPAVYTGGEVMPEMTVIASDGTALKKDVDYKIIFSEDNGNIMFGDAVFTLRSTDRSYGSVSGSFPIRVVLPENPPELSVGEHTAELTLEDRLAVYRVTAETDTDYTLTSSDVMNEVLRVFSPEAEMLGQVYGTGTKSLSFTVPAGETRYVMIKFNGTKREGTMRFALNTTLRLLSDCEAVTEPAPWTGERVQPTVRFYDGDRLLTEGTDYRLRYTCDDCNIGTATANFIGMGDYFGICDVEYPIIAPELSMLESFGTHPIVLEYVYGGSEQREDSDYLVYRYTSGTDTSMRFSIYDCMCKTTVQRYDSEGKYCDSIFIRSLGTMEYEMQAGETCYLLFSKTDISSWNQIFRCVLQDMDSADFVYENDAAHGVSYRISRQRNYAEPTQFDFENGRITLLPEYGGVPVGMIPEGLFVDIPEDAVVIGYPGCPAAQYADRYRFAYEDAEAPADSQLRGDLNGDGTVSIADAVLLAQLISEQRNLVLQTALLRNSDYNDDGITDFLDLSALLRALASP